jgi:hypothetical protein
MGPTPLVAPVVALSFSSPVVKITLFEKVDIELSPTVIILARYLIVTVVLVKQTWE